MKNREESLEDEIGTCFGTDKYRKSGMGRDGRKKWYCTLALPEEKIPLIECYYQGEFIEILKGEGIMSQYVTFYKCLRGGK